jgi:hypothetical protein
VIDGRTVLRRELGKIVFVRDNVAMPCDKVEGTVILLNTDQLPVGFTDNMPVDVQILVDSGNWIKKIARIGQAMATERTKIKELPHRSPDFGNVAAGFFGIWAQVDAEPDTSLDDTYLARLQENLPHLCLYIEST